VGDAVGATLRLEASVLARRRVGYVTCESSPPSLCERVRRGGRWSVVVPQFFLPLDLLPQPYYHRSATIGSITWLVRGGQVFASKDLYDVGLKAARGVLPLRGHLL
jgi:hypothetical protein